MLCCKMSPTFRLEMARVCTSNSELQRPAYENYDFGQIFRSLIIIIFSWIV